MQVTFYNASSDPVYVGTLWMSLDAGKSVTTRRTVADLDRDQHLKEMVETGIITLAFTAEAGDSAVLGYPSSLPSYAAGARPQPTDVPLFTVVFNTDENAPNWSDGTYWRDAEGNIT